jgi:hypothetical protein
VGLHRFCKQCNGRVPVSINRMQVVCSSGHVTFDLEEEYLELVAGNKQCCSSVPALGRSHTCSLQLELSFAVVPARAVP